VGFDGWANIPGLWNSQEIHFLNTYPAIKKVLPTWPQWDWAAHRHYIALKKILRKFSPKLMVYMMQDPEVAHVDTYARYVLAIKNSDEQIYETWNYINTAPEYKGNTYLFVCVDHTRDACYMSHNNNSFTNPSRTWLYVYGPDIKKNKIVSRPVYHRDIFSTMAHIFNIGIPADTQGHVLMDCFKHFRP